jgi:hypothetical protein
MRSTLSGLILAAVCVIAAPVAPAVAQAQGSASLNDIQRLQDGVYDLTTDLSQLRARDANAARDYQQEADELRDEVIYLRVKIRKGEAVARTEYSDVRDRIDDLRSRIASESTGRPVSSSSTSGPGTGGASTASPASVPAMTGSSARPSTTASSVIPVGTMLDVRLQDTLNSGTSQIEDRFIATTVVDLGVDGRTLIPAGSEVRGVVSAVNSAGRVDRKASLTVTFDQITIDGRTYPIRGTVDEAIEGGGYGKDAGRIGTGAGLGGIVGGLLGGFKGALAGILIGGGAVVAGTEGKDVELPAGTILRVSLDSPPALR